MTLLFLSDITWENLTQRPQHLARNLARRHRVLWIEPVTMGYPWSLRPRRGDAGLQMLSVPQLPLNARARRIRALARMLSAVAPLVWLLERWQWRIVRRALGRLGWGKPEAVLVENFQLVSLAGRSGGRLVFDYIDDAFGFAPLPRLARRQWDRTVRSSAAISVTAPRLRELIMAGHPDAAGRIHLVPNGVEYDRFAPQAAAPAELGPRVPRLCYVGSVYPWLDFELLEEIVRSYPDLQLAVIGRSHPEVRAALGRLEKMPNFLYLGPRPYAGVPAYLHASDAGIIPFRRNRLTEAVNPVKLYEYSAAGIPTISTAFSDDLDAFRKEIFIGATRAEVLDLIPRALEKGRDPAFRDLLRSFARRNDWEARAAAVAALLAPGAAPSIRSTS